MITDIMRRTILGRKDKFLFRGYEEGLIDFNDADSEVGLYIHIPFCKTICPYCPYNKIIYENGKAYKYKTALIKELTLYKKHIGNRKITSLYIGGGTPTLLMPELREVLEFISESYDFEGDIGIEIHPAEVSGELLDALVKTGVNLVSLGVQTFNDSILEFLGRGYGSGDLDRALSMIREYEFKCIDVDIMTNLPGQTIEDIEYDLRKAYSYEIDQLSVYPLIIFPMTGMGRAIKGNGLSRFNDLQEKRILKVVDEISREQGYERSSVWTYGKDSSSRYTSVTRESFIGVGAGATSLAGSYFYLNTFDVDEYIKALEGGRLPINIVNHMTDREKMIFWIFWRCYDGVIDEARFNELFAKDMEEEFGLLFTLLRLFGMAEKQGRRFALTDWGRFAYHFVEKQYSIRYLNDLWQESMKQPWIEEIRL